MIRRAARAFPLARLLLVVEAGMAVKRQYDRLDPAERRDLARILRASRGRPWTITPADRARLTQIARTLDPAALAREMSGLGTGRTLPGRGRRVR